MNKLQIKPLVFASLICLLLTSQAYSQSWVLAGTVSNPGVRPSVSVVDYNTAWIADGEVDTPKVFRTTNGGVNWVALPTTGIIKEIYCIWATSTTNSFVGEGVLNGGANLFATTNSGLNWTVVATTGNNDGYFNGIVFSRLDPNYGFAIATKVFKTSNAGQNWVQILSGVNGVSNAHNSLFLVDRFFYGFGLNQGAARVHLTTDDGAGWVNQNVNLTGSYTSAAAFNDDKLNGLAATSTSLPTISRTTNGGTTWVNQTISGGVSGECKIKFVTGSGVAYLLSNNGIIVRSIDNGVTWNVMPTAGVTGLYHFDFNRIGNIIVGYAVSTDGRVIRLADTVALTGTGTLNSNIPSEFKLDQNYPNPFNPATSIGFDIPKSAFVSLIVYDVLGRELTALVNEELMPGHYEYRWDASNYSSGVYYYKLEAGDFAGTKKMTLIK